MVIGAYTCVLSVITAPVRYDLTGLAGMALGKSDSIRSYTPVQIFNKLPKS